MRVRRPIIISYITARNILSFTSRVTNDLNRNTLVSNECSSGNVVYVNLTSEGTEIADAESSAIRTLRFEWLTLGKCYFADA